ncbi:MAG: FHA domain-containing protein [Bryobacteraceae bacterium]
MPKFCNNGHQMEDSWEICPYCQKTGYQPHVGGSGQLKPRLEADTQPAIPTGAAAARKTILLADQAPRGTLVGWLVAMTGAQRGEDFRVREGQNIIGTSNNSDIILNDSSVSGRHASIRYRDQKFLLTDLDSLNGTFVNDERESGARVELKDNDMVRVGGVSLKFKIL